MSKKNLYLLLLIIGTGFWGISFSLVKTGVGSSVPFVFLAYRFLIAAAAMLVIFPSSLRKFNAEIIKKSLHLAIPLFIGIVLQTYGLQHSPAGQCAFIAGLCVIVLPFVNLVLYKRHIKSNILLASAIAISGLFIICVKDGLSIGTGDIYTLISTFGFAVYLIKVSKYSTAETLIPSVTMMFFICCLLAFGMANSNTDSQWITQDRGFWIGVLFSSLLSTAYMYSVSNKAQQYIGAEKVAIVYLFEPIFASTAAFFILGEPFTWRLILGGVLIILAVIIAEFGGRNLSRKRL